MVSHWKTLAQLVRPDWWRYAALSLVLGLAYSLPLAGPLIVRRVIDQATAGEATTAGVARWGSAYLALAATAQAVAVLVALFATQLAWRTANGLRLRLARHVLSLDNEFQRSHSPGELIHRVDGDVTAVSDLLGRVQVAIGGAMTLTAGTVVVVAVIDWRLGSAMAIYTGIGVYVLLGQRDEAVDEATDESMITAALYGEIEEQLTASTDLRANGAGHYGLKRLIDVCGLGLHIKVHREKRFVIGYARTMAVLLVGLSVALAGGAWLHANGTLTIGTVFLLFQYTTMLRRPLEQALDELPMIHKATGAAVRVGELLAMESTITFDGTQSPPPGPLEVAFSDVSFDYGDEPVLSDINVVFPAGQSTGIVGRTGSGKTTLSRLVLRLLDASEGEVEIGGLPIKAISEDELRHRIALVPQDVHLLAGTLRDNVTLYDNSVSDDEVREALRSVGLGHLADGSLDALVDGRGSGLSAGQAQLVALARVWLRKPDIVVLDEATARVDPATEDDLQAAIASLLKGRTALVIAHRLSTLRHVDNVLVLDGGKVVEFGPRLELEANNAGRFKQLLVLALGQAES